VTDKIAAGAYRWAVNKGLAAGALPVRPSKVKAAKNAKAIAAKIVKSAPKTKADAVKSVTKSPEEIERIKAANMARMKAVLGKVKQNIRMETDEVPFAETDSFAAPAFLTKDEMYDLI
jgi:lipoate-protein ligase A